MDKHHHHKDRTDKYGRLNQHPDNHCLVFHHLPSSVKIFHQEVALIASSISRAVSQSSFTEAEASATPNGPVGFTSVSIRNLPFASWDNN